VAASWQTFRHKLATSWQLASATTWRLAGGWLEASRQPTSVRLASTWQLLAGIAHGDVISKDKREQLARERNNNSNCHAGQASKFRGLAGGSSTVRQTSEKVQLSIVDSHNMWLSRLEYRD